MHAHFAALKQACSRTQSTRHIGRGQAASLDVAGVTQTTQQAFGFGLRFALLQARHIGQIIGLFQASMEVTCVVLQSNRCLVRELGDEIATADFILSQAHFPGSARNNALQQIGGFRPTCASVSIDRRGVGEPGIHLHIDLWRLVLTRQQRGVKDGRHSGGEGREVSPQVGVGVDTKAQELAIWVHRQLRMGDMVTTMGI